MRVAMRMRIEDLDQDLHAKIMLDSTPSLRDQM